MLIKGPEKTIKLDNNPGNLKYFNFCKNYKNVKPAEHVHGSSL
jgi:hypothetical protein